MAIKAIEISNFKSYDELKVNLNNFNILIGPNASGKSNFVQFFRFIADIMSLGLENAISMQGGIDYLRNINLDRSRPFSFKIHCKTDRRYRPPARVEKHRVQVRINEVIYECSLQFSTYRRSYKIVKDVLTRKIELFKISKVNKKDEELELIGPCELKLSKEKGKINISTPTLPDVLKGQEKNLFFFWQFVKGLKFPAKQLIIETPALEVLPSLKPFSRFSIYDIDPRLPKRAVPIKGKTELEEDGSNLTVALNNILKNKEAQKKFFNIIRDFLPFVENLKIDTIADKSVLFKLREQFSKTKYLPASFISDGTIHITALIVALYFELEKGIRGETQKVIIIEEPERNIHPHLISKLINMMRSASDNNQIIATTHNPEMIRHAKLDDILLVARDKNGFSNIFRANEKEEIKTFLEDEIGIDELYVRGLLDA